MSSTESLALAGWRRSPALARSLPFACYIAFLALAPLVEKAFPGWDPRWLYAVQIGLVGASLACFADCYGELRGAPPASRVDWALALGVGVAVFVAWINLDLPGLVLGEGRGFNPARADASLDWALVAV